MEYTATDKAIDILAERVLESGVQPIKTLFTPVFDCYSAQTVAYVGKTYLAGGSLGVLTPEEYLPVIDNLNNALNVLTATLGDFCEQSACFSLDLYRIEFFSFPAALSCLSDENLYNSLHSLTAPYRALKGKICLVFDKTVLCKDENLLIKAFADIRSAGLKIAIKGFGDKYMPLSLLGTVTPDYLFLNGKETAKAEDKKLFAPVGALIKYATNLGIKTIAECAKTDKGIRELSLVECFGATVCDGYKGLRSAVGEKTLEDIANEKEDSE